VEELFFGEAETVRRLLGDVPGEDEEGGEEDAGQEGAGDEGKLEDEERGGKAVSLDVGG
jgi:hypothetical protein